MEGKMEEFRFEKTSISSSSLSIYDKDGFRKRIFEEIASLRTSGKSVFQSITCVSKIYRVGEGEHEPRKKKKRRIFERRTVFTINNSVMLPFWKSGTSTSNRANRQKSVSWSVQRRDPSLVKCSCASPISIVCASAAFACLRPNSVPFFRKILLRGIVISI